MKLKKLFGVLVCLSAMSILSYDAVAGRSSSSSSRSSSSSSSRSSGSSYGGSSKSSSGGGIWGGTKPSSSKPSSGGIWGGTKPSTTPPAKTPPPKDETIKTPNNVWGGNKSTTPAPAAKPAAPAKPLTPAQAARQKKYEEDKTKFDSAKATGKAFTSKDAAVADWKKKNTGKFESKFTTEPTTRPSYIPPTYQSSTGYSAPVSYNQQYGGYGYMDALGTFILWDALTDVAFQNNNMQQSGYYVGTPPAAPQVAQAAPVQQSNSGWTTFATCFIGLMTVGVFVTAFVMFKRSM